MKPIVKEFTFSKEELEELRNIEIGIISATQTYKGLNFYKSTKLVEIYKRLGIEAKKKGFNVKVNYTLNPNKIIYTQTPINKDLLVKK